MFNLLLKDIRIMIGKKTTIGRRLASASFVVFVFACFVGLEIYLFSGILSKISDIKGAPDAFLCVFLFIVTCFMTVSDLFTAKKLFFDAKDIEMLSVRPVTNGQIISSKLITIFATHYITAFIECISIRSKRCIHIESIILCQFQSKIHTQGAPWLFLCSHII